MNLVCRPRKMMDGRLGSWSRVVWERQTVCVCALIWFLTQIPPPPCPYVQAPSQPQAHIIARLVALALTASTTLWPRQCLTSGVAGRRTCIVYSKPRAKRRVPVNGFWRPDVWRAAAERSMERWRGAALTSFFMHEVVACASVSKFSSRVWVLRTLLNLVPHQMNLLRHIVREMRKLWPT